MKLSVSIGIPAYNESQNIRKLIESLLSQKTETIDVVEILIVNDVSTDTTADEVRSVADARIRLIEHEKRSGLAAGQDRIAQEATGDILVMLDADVLPQNNKFLDEICKPLIKDNSIGLVGADIIAAPGKSFFENVLVISHELKTNMYRKINYGKNIYLCHGRARAFSRSLYSTIHWPDKFAEDQYSYLYARSQGFGFAYAPEATVLFRSPASAIDYFRQSLRFTNAHKTILKKFDGMDVSYEYTLPLKVIAPSVGASFLKSPLRTTVYILILLQSRFLSYFVKLKNQSSFEPSTSSKKVA